MSLSVLIQTFNEELNLPHTLESLGGWVDQIFVVDSGSSDSTRQIAESHGATFVHHDWQGYAGQKNWALNNLPFTGDWVLIIDADEAITPALRTEIMQWVGADPETVEEAGFYINRVFIFAGSEIHHCGYFPSWNLRLFKRGRAEYEDRLVHEHMIVDGPVGYLKGLLRHEDRRGLEHFYAKHNRYSTLEARQMHDHPERWPGWSGFLSNRIVRLRFIKNRVMPLVPLPWLWRFLYMFVLRAGFLDGRAGLALSSAIAVYEHMVHAKFRELKRLGATPMFASSGLAVGEGHTDVQRISRADRDLAESATPPIGPAVASTRAAQSAANAAVAENNRTGKRLETRPHRSQTRHVPQLGSDNVTARSPWTFRQNVGRVLWMFTSKTLFRLSFHNWYAWRRMLLRLFGAKVGRHARVRPSARIEIPWNIEIGEHSMVGDEAILYSLGHIRIGDRVVISQYAHLCAGTHDFNDPDFPLVRPPITIEDEAWVAADSFVGPNVTIGRRAILGARASAFRDVPPGKIAGGNPARVIRDREPLHLPGGADVATNGDLPGDSEAFSPTEPEVIHA